MLLSSLQQESGMRRRLFLQFSTHYIDIIHRIYTHCISFHILLIRNWFCIDGGNSTWKGSLRNVFAFRLVVATLGLELNPSAGHDAGGQHVTVKLLLRAEEYEVSLSYSLMFDMSNLKPRTLKASSVYSSSSLSSMESTLVLPWDT